MDEIEMEYAIAKQLTSATEIKSHYGNIYLDDEMRAAIKDAIEPILEKRLKNRTGKQHQKK